MLISIAFGAGVLSLFTPCSVAILPSYLSVGMLSREYPGKLSTIQIITKTIMMSGGAFLGFLSVFIPLGLILSFFFRGVIRLFPFASIVVSLLLLVMGGLMILDIPIPLISAIPRVLPRRGGATGFYLLGAAHGTLSLSCNLPVFLMVTSYAAIIGSSSDVVVATLLYVGGFGLVLFFMSIVTTTSGSLTRRLHASLRPYVGVIGGSLVVATAVYILMYQLYHIR